LRRRGSTIPPARAALEPLETALNKRRPPQATGVLEMSSVRGCVLGTGVAADVERPDGDGAAREPLDDVREEDGSDEDDGKTSRKEQAGHR
jgi:hypothetical protein